MKKLKGIIITDNYDTYKYYCKENKLNYYEYLYVTSDKDLKGIRNLPVYYVGQYWDNLAYKKPELARIEYENSRRINMKAGVKERLALILTGIIVFGIYFYGIQKVINTLEELTITYVLR